MNTTTWNIFQSELRGVAAKILGSDYGDWFDSQHARIVLWWNSGESVESAKEMLKSFAEGNAAAKRKAVLAKTPKQLAISYTRV